MGRVSLGHYIVAVQGLAVFRNWLIGDRACADRRIAELADVVTRADQPPLSLEFDVPETDVRSGYGRWAGSYDSLPNPLILLEEPTMRAMIDALPVGVALDAACGTGRHAKYLDTRGHRVIGVDASAEMLAKARAQLPRADLRTGDLLNLPLESDSVDLAVCALALTHCADIGPPLRELARVLRPGGHLLLSDFHPMMVGMGGTAFFVAADGSMGYVRSYFHLHSAYWTAFTAADLEVQQCVEPVFGEAEAALMLAGFADTAREAFVTAFTGVPGALIWDLTRRR